MEPVTTYVSADGTKTVIAEMNNFHLVNSLLKTNSILVLNPNGFGSATIEYESIKATQTALKDEVYKRMDNRPV
jgi:hypothetical protein